MMVSSWDLAKVSAGTIQVNMHDFAWYNRQHFRLSKVEPHTVAAEASHSKVHVMLVCSAVWWRPGMHSS